MTDMRETHGKKAGVIKYVFLMVWVRNSFNVKHRLSSTRRTIQYDSKTWHA